MKTTIDRAIIDRVLEVLTDNRSDIARCESATYMAQYYDKAISDLREALAQPQQEPVAEVQVKMTGGNAGIATIIREIYDPLRWPLKPGDKLYTAPPARKPLTKEEITAISKQVCEGGPEDSIDRFVRAIEAVHGIKEMP
jgi:hypothetical protein